MKYLFLLWSNLKRKKTRSVLTVLSITVAFMLLAYLGAIRQGFIGQRFKAHFFLNSKKISIPLRRSNNNLLQFSNLYALNNSYLIALVAKGDPQKLEQRLPDLLWQK